MGRNSRRITHQKLDFKVGEPKAGYMNPISAQNSTDMGLVHHENIDAIIIQLFKLALLSFSEYPATVAHEPISSV